MSLHVALCVIKSVRGISLKHIGHCSSDTSLDRLITSTGASVGDSDDFADLAHPLLTLWRSLLELPRLEEAIEHVSAWVTRASRGKGAKQ